MSKHTPGPWMDGDKHSHGTSVQHRSLTVAWCGANGVYGRAWSHTISPTEAKANARLIAAAPDLLEFAQSFAAWADTLPNIADNDELARLAEMAEAVIAEAEGKP